MTLVSSRLANYLRAKRHSNSVKLAGMYASGYSRHTICLHFASVYDPNEQNADVMCHVSDDSFDMTTPDLETILSMPFLRGKVMADWGKQKSIDIILGVKEIPYCYHSDLCHSPDCRVEARRSIFGWVLRGRTETPGNLPRILSISSADEKADSLVQKLWETEGLPTASALLTAEEAQALDNSQETIKRIAIVTMLSSCQERLILPAWESLDLLPCGGSTPIRDPC